MGLVDELERLSKLHQDGALSASQYEEAKVRLLKADDDEDSAQLGRPRTMAAVAPQTGGTTDSPTPVRWAAYVVASAGLVLWGLSHMDGRLWFGYDGPWFFVDGWTYLFAGIGAFLWWQYLASSDDAEARRRRVLRAFGITFGCTTLTVVAGHTVPFLLGIVVLFFAPLPRSPVADALLRGATRHFGRSAGADAILRSVKRHIGSPSGELHDSTDEVETEANPAAALVAGLPWRSVVPVCVAGLAVGWTMEEFVIGELDRLRYWEESLPSRLIAVTGTGVWLQFLILGRVERAKKAIRAGIGAALCLVGSLTAFDFWDSTWAYLGFGAFALAGIPGSPLGNFLRSQVGRAVRRGASKEGWEELVNDWQGDEPETAAPADDSEDGISEFDTPA